MLSSKLQKIGKLCIFSNLWYTAYSFTNLHIPPHRNSAMAMSNSMAFISQFGEYNPGGGKDEVLKYLNEAEIQVKLAEKALAKVIDCVESKAPE